MVVNCNAPTIGEVNTVVVMLICKIQTTEAHSFCLFGAVEK